MDYGPWTLHQELTEKQKAFLNLQRKFSSTIISDESCGDDDDDNNGDGSWVYEHWINQIDFKYCSI